MKKIKLIVFACAFITIQACAKESEKPNIVFILIDDLGWTDVSYMGSDYYRTPHIDDLAKGGMVFTNGYANAANCAPTRSSILSGQYTPRHEVYTVGNPNRGKANTRRLKTINAEEAISLDKITIAEALKSAGYTSAAIGKWHVGNTPQLQGFDFGLDRGDIGYGGGFFPLDSSDEYLTDRLTDEAIEFISENKETPFFLYLAHHAVHTPIQAKQEIIDKYGDADADDACHNNATYAAMIESVDESVFRINKTLEDLGLSENTVLIFFSDNGGHGTYTCQKPLRGGKGMYYEGGIREPMFVYWPKTVKAGTTCDIPVISTDFYPTFVDLSGASKPEGYTLDGVSLVDVFKKQKPLGERALFWYFPAYLQAYKGVLMSDARDMDFRTRPVSVIRKGDWKLMLFHEEWSLDGGREMLATNNAIELYNLKEDISETKNLSNIETKKRDELLDELLVMNKEMGAEILNTPNPKYVKH